MGINFLAKLLAFLHTMMLFLLVCFAWVGPQLAFAKSEGVTRRYTFVVCAKISLFFSLLWWTAYFV